MMFARCPACQTVFRVRPEQLRAHRGEVRCGRCRTPFNALEHLIEADSRPAAPATPAMTSFATEVNEPTASGTTLRSTASSANDLRSDSFFILEERPSDSRGDSASAHHVPPFGASPGRVSRAGDEATTAPGNETPPPLVGSVPDRGGDALDFEIPDRLLVPRRPLRTSDLLRREPAIGEPAIEPPPHEPAAAAGEPSCPESIDLSDFTPAEPAMPPRAEVPADEWADFGRRVPFDEWAQRVRSKGGDRSEPGTGFALPRDEAHSAPDTVPQPDLPPEPASATHELSQESAAAFAELTERDNTVNSEMDFAAPVTAAPPAGPATPIASSDALETARLDAAYGPRPASPAKRWLLGLGIGLLLGVLGVQAAYLFRAEITREWPQLRPAYLAACEALGCTVPLPRLADLVGIGTSDLQSEPGRPGRFILNATVRNRAPHPQAYPHLELTLTDAQDRPVIRRVLEPKEWVPPRQLQRSGIEDGFSGGSEIAVKVPFEAEGVEAVGYRLYVFYP